MSELYDQFKDKVLGNWPTVIDEVLHAICATRKGLSAESTLAHFLDEVVKSKILDESKANEAIGDLVAFGVTPDSKAAWDNAYYGPSMSWPVEDGGHFESPSRVRVTPDAISQWRNRRTKLTHAVAVARYADTAWDLAAIAGVQRDIADAIAAIDAYLEFGDQAIDFRRGENRLVRALMIARSIRDQGRIAKVTEKLFNGAMNESGHASDRYCTTAAIQYLLLEDGLSSDQAASLVAHSEQLVKRECVRANRYPVQAVGDLLLRHYRRKQLSEEEKRLAKVISGCFELLAERDPGIGALFNHEIAHKYLSDAGLQNDAQRAKKNLAAARETAKSQMSKYEYEIPDSEEQIRKQAEAVTDGSLYEVLGKYFATHLLSKQYTVQSFKGVENGAAIMQLMPQTIITDTGGSINMPPVGENREQHLLRHFAWLLDVNSRFLDYTTRLLIEKHTLTPHWFAAIGEASALFPRWRHRVRLRAFEAYFCHDYCSFICTMVPQIEHAFRCWMRESGIATEVTRDHAMWRQLTLHAMLSRSDLVGLMGEELNWYVKGLLIEDRGWNLRDSVCHGLADQTWFSKAKADRLIHLTVGLSLVGPQPTSLECVGQESCAPRIRGHKEI